MREIFSRRLNSTIHLNPNSSQHSSRLPSSSSTAPAIRHRFGLDPLVSKTRFSHPTQYVSIVSISHLTVVSRAVASSANIRGCSLNLPANNILRYNFRSELPSNSSYSLSFSSLFLLSSRQLGTSSRTALAYQNKVKQPTSSLVSLVNFRSPFQPLQFSLALPVESLRTKIRYCHPVNKLTKTANMTMYLASNIQFRALSTNSKTKPDTPLSSAAGATSAATKSKSMQSKSNPVYKYASFATFAATAFAAYALVGANAESVHVEKNSDGSNLESLENHDAHFTETKKGENYGYEYIGFDTSSMAFRGKSTAQEIKAEMISSIKSPASNAVVFEALSAAGLNEQGIVSDDGGKDVGDHITIHPMHIHRFTCPLYGCPFLPLDVHYEEEVKAQLNLMRKLSSTSSDSSSGGEEESGGDAPQILKSTGSDKAATLTLIGYKGGQLNQQINQDRAFVLSPYLFWKINSNTKNDANDSQPMARLLGVFDGHARYGERVSEYAVRTLPALLGNKLVQYGVTSDGQDSTNNVQKDRDIAKILHQTFLELDSSAPADPSGGCTASVVLQLGDKIYVANAGDSRSFVGVHVIPPKESSEGSGDSGGLLGKEPITAVLYATREDKPHLELERERVEQMGGTVYLPPQFIHTGKGTTRVMYKDPTTQNMSGLAMSRSIGDWDAGYVGVIPDPLVDVLSIKEMKQRVLEELNGSNGGANGACSKLASAEIDPASGEAKVDPKAEGDCILYTEKDVKVFAFSATDGLLDYLPVDIIATTVAKGLYDTSYNVVSDGADGDEEKDGSSHPLTACENLIYAAAKGWQDDKGGRYRDDIAISVADLESPE